MNEPIETTAVVIRNNNTAVGQALSVNEIVAQVNLIQQVMAKVMKDGEHFGTIPGCGDKKTLFQPGAQKLTMTFRLAPEYTIQETDLGRGHKEYRVVATLKSIQTGNFVGEGVGVCSTMETKYRYHGGARKCPACGKETIIKGKAEYGGGWLCFARKGGCGAKWPDGAQVIEGQSIERVEHDNPADHYNCVTPETKVLTHDLQWVPAGELESGDIVIGVNEDSGSEYARNLAIGEVTVHGRRVDHLYEVAFEDGRIVRCNGEHKWLVKKVGLKGTEWVSTEDVHNEIIERNGRPRHWTVMSVCKPWIEDTSREAGYIAGLLDADGSLGSSQLFVMFAQQANTVLALLQRGLIERGYQLGMSPCKTLDAIARSTSQKQVYQVRVLGGFAEQLRLLGSIRPPRLLERWLTLWDLSTRRLEGRGSGAGSPVRILSVTPIGTGEIVTFGTSCRTYLAEGLVCHNTVLKMAKKRSFVDATITATAASDIFTQDIGDDEENGQEPPQKAATGFHEALHKEKPDDEGEFDSAATKPTIAQRHAQVFGEAPETPPAASQPAGETETPEAKRERFLALFRPYAAAADKVFADHGLILPPEAASCIDDVKIAQMTNANVRALLEEVKQEQARRKQHAPVLSEGDAALPELHDPADYTPVHPDSEPWRQLIVPFGKNRGVKLGDLPKGSLRFYVVDWKPEPHEFKGRLYQPKESDVAFYKAIQRSAKEIIQRYGFDTEDRRG